MASPMQRAVEIVRGVLFGEMADRDGMISFLRDAGAWSEHEGGHCFRNGVCAVCGEQATAADFLEAIDSIRDQIRAAERIMPEVTWDDYAADTEGVLNMAPVRVVGETPDSTMVLTVPAHDSQESDVDVGRLLREVLEKGSVTLSQDACGNVEAEIREHDGYRFVEEGSTLSEALRALLEGE